MSSWNFGDESEKDSMEELGGASGRGTLEEERDN